MEKRLRELLEEEDFSIFEDEENGLTEISKYSPAGQDFSFIISDYKNLKEFLEKTRDAAKNYDPSEEAMLWLDSSGHGKNGAPYEMVDLYNDMVACKENIEAAAEIIKKYLEENAKFEIIDGENKQFCNSFDDFTAALNDASKNCQENGEPFIINISRGRKN